MSINRCIISGNITREPELKATQGGTAVLRFGVAVNERRKNQQTGEWESYPNFVDCVVFGKRAEALPKFIHKGSKVAIDGRLHYSSWEKDGQRRSKLEVVVDECEFLSGSKAENQAEHAQQANYAQQYDSAPNSATTAPQNGNYQPYADVYDEDIPFDGAAA